MTNSERRVGLVRKALDPPGTALPDWRIFAGLTGALGFGQQFAWPDAAAVFDEFVACTAGRVCDMTGLTHERLRREGGVQWPCPDAPEHTGTVRLYAEHQYPTPDGRARFEPTPHAETAETAETTDGRYPLMLTTGRVADQWHTMTRTGKSEALRASAAEPFIELSPEDAKATALSEGDRALVRSRRGDVRLRVVVVEDMAAGVAFAPFH